MIGIIFGEKTKINQRNKTATPSELPTYFVCGELLEQESISFLFLQVELEKETLSVKKERR